MVKKITLSRGLFALVDDDDFDQVSKFKWIATKGGKGFYAVTSHGPDTDRVNKPKHVTRKIVDKKFAREMARLGIVPRFAA